MTVGPIISPQKQTSCYLLCRGQHTSHLWADGPSWILRGAREMDRVDSAGWGVGDMQRASMRGARATGA